MQVAESKKWMNSLEAVAVTSWVETASRKVSALSKGQTKCQVFIFFSKDKKKALKSMKGILSEAQIDRLQNSSSILDKFEGPDGSVILAFPKILLGDMAGNKSQLRGSLYGTSRDLMGAVVASIAADSADVINLQFVDPPAEGLRGCLVGIDLAAYSFKSTLSGKAAFKKMVLLKNKGAVSAREVKEAVAISSSVNLARHLVNMPPNVLQPQSYAQFIKKLFKTQSNTTVDVWSGQKLEKEKMGLLLAVGKGAEHAPCFVHIKYRPPGSKGKKPVAFVGKGITFDSGGLNLKPTAGMRLMKKDMGGSASVVGTAWAAAQSGLKRPLDFYISLAENAVNSNAFRPSDVYVSRSGQTVEIDNTDAEGRLVLADALDVATTRKALNQPEMVVDVATLTGAVKVGLGAEIAGLFCNSDRMAKQFEDCADQASEKVWRMPMWKGYEKALKSPVADMANSASGFGGAIRAALFLQKFTNSVPWAHLDIYSWTESSNGALLEKGGSGQMVQTLTEWLRKN